MKYSHLLDYSENRAKLLNSIKATKQLLAAVEEADQACKPLQRSVQMQSVSADHERLKCQESQQAQTVPPAKIGPSSDKLVAANLIPKQILENKNGCEVETSSAKLIHYDSVCERGRIETRPDNSQLKCINTNSNNGMDRFQYRPLSGAAHPVGESLGKRNTSDTQETREVSSDVFHKSKLVRSSLFQTPGDPLSKPLGISAGSFNRPSPNHPKIVPSAKSQGEDSSRSMFFNLTEGDCEGIVLPKSTKPIGKERTSRLSNIKPGKLYSHSFPIDPLEVDTKRVESTVSQRSNDNSPVSPHAIPQKKSVGKAGTSQDTAAEKNGAMQLEQLVLPQVHAPKLDQVLTTPVMILPSGSSKVRSAASEQNRSRVTSTDQHESAIMTRQRPQDVAHNLQNTAKGNGVDQNAVPKGRSERSIGSGGLTDVDLGTGLSHTTGGQTPFTKHEIDKVQRYLNTLAEGLQTVVEKSLTASRREGIYKKTLHFIQAMFELDDAQLKCLLTNRVGPYLTVIKRLLSVINDTTSAEFQILLDSLDHLLAYIKNKTRNYVIKQLTAVHRQEINGCRST